MHIGTWCFLQVDQILSKEELRGTVLNSNKLGERKNVNLPGVQVTLWSLLLSLYSLSCTSTVPLAPPPVQKAVSPWGEGVGLIEAKRDQMEIAPKSTQKQTGIKPEPGGALY